jgi:hypothetical protein
MKQDDEYSKAFNADMPDMDAQIDGEVSDVAPAMTLDPAAVDAAMADETAAAMPAESPEEMPEAPAESTPDAMEDEQLTPEDIQRKKSWEGRLKKREEELAAREAAASAPAMPAEEDAGYSEESTAEMPMDEFADETTETGDVMTQVEARARELEASGEMESLVSALVSDFGLDVVAALTALGGKLTGGSDDVGIALQQKLDNLISDMNQGFRSMHSEMIRMAEEDFQEVAQSPGFVSWLESLTDKEKEQADQVVESGNPNQIVKLLRKYKEAMSNTAPEIDDAAMGVRGSAPIGIPNRSGMSPEDEYMAAWNTM